MLKLENVEKVIERFRNCPVAGEEYILGKLGNGEYFVAHGAEDSLGDCIESESCLNGARVVFCFSEFDKALTTVISDLTSFQLLYPIDKKENLEQIEKIQCYLDIFGDGFDVDISNDKVLVEREAEILWKLENGSIKNKKNLFVPGTLRTFSIGDEELILVTPQGMNLVFGNYR